MQAIYYILLVKVPRGTSAPPRPSLQTFNQCLPSHEELSNNIIIFQPSSRIEQGGVLIS